MAYLFHLKKITVVRQKKDLTI